MLVDRAAVSRPRKERHVFAADWGVGQVLWTMIYFFFLFAFIWILITVLIDLFRDHTLSGWAKALWVIFLIFLPLIGTIVYLIARGGGMHERAAQAAARQQKAMDEYIRQTAGAASGGGAAEQIAQAHTLLESGAITLAEFVALKAKALT